MKIWLLSDLHLEFVDLRQPLAIPDADVCVVAGDLCRAPANGVHWLARHIAHAMPCIYVAGNHEFYKISIREALEDGRSAASGFPDIHFLENDIVIIDGVRFIGATLWTDYRIEGYPEVAMFHARERMNDYRQIARQRHPWQHFVPETAYRMHPQSRLFIGSALKADPIKDRRGHASPATRAIHPVEVQGRPSQCRLCFRPVRHNRERPTRVVGPWSYP